MTGVTSSLWTFLDRWRLRRARRLVKKVGKGYNVARVHACDSECWQTGNCTGACDRA